MSSQEPGTLVTICRKKTQQAAYAGDSLGWARNGPLRTLAVGTLSCHERHLPGSPTHIPPRPPCRKRQRQERDRQRDRQGRSPGGPSQLSEPAQPCCLTYRWLWDARPEPCLWTATELTTHSLAAEYPSCWPNSENTASSSLKLLGLRSAATQQDTVLNKTS